MQSISHRSSPPTHWDWIHHCNTQTLTHIHRHTHTHRHRHTHREGRSHGRVYTPSIGLPDFNSLRNGVSLSKDNSEVLTTGITWGTAASPAVFSGKQFNSDFNTWFCNTVDKLLQSNNIYNRMENKLPYCRALRLRVITCVASSGCCCK